ncbi:uncharacterized protein LOC144072770 isoform X5 [Stigmatopora argus]
MHLRSISPFGTAISMLSVERLAPKRAWLNQDEAVPVCPEPCTPLRGEETGPRSMVMSRPCRTRHTKHALFRQTYMD